MTLLQRHLSLTDMLWVIAEPHKEIVSEEFYKHISGEELENLRMQQLLSWCGHRALESTQATRPSNDLDAGALNLGEFGSRAEARFGIDTDNRSASNIGRGSQGGITQWSVINVVYTGGF
jgi:hypothetical protein